MCGVRWWFILEMKINVCVYMSMRYIHKINMKTTTFPIYINIYICVQNNNVNRPMSEHI